MIASPAQTVLKIEKEVVVSCEDDNSVMDDEIAKIRSEFDAAKLGFIKIPETLKEMPKMNPKGSIM